MDVEQIKDLIRRELPNIMRDDLEFREFVRDIIRTRFSNEYEFQSRFDRDMERLRLEREKDSRELDEQAKKWEKNDRKWDEGE
jgi:hypothetical protein